jgi:hypothetical protein
VVVDGSEMMSNGVGPSTAAADRGFGSAALRVAFLVLTADFEARVVDMTVVFFSER